MIKQRPRRLQASRSLAALPILLLLDFGTGAAYGQQAAKPEGSQTSDKSAGQEFAFARPARGKRDQVFRLAQVLFQDARNEHGVPDDNHGHI